MDVGCLGESFDETLISLLDSYPLSPAWSMIAKACSDHFSFPTPMLDGAPFVAHHVKQDPPRPFEPVFHPHVECVVAEKQQSAPLVSEETEGSSPASDSSSPSPSPSPSPERVDETVVARHPRSTRTSGSKSKKSNKRKWSRSHTRKEPTPDEFSSNEEYSEAWSRWRELRDSNNNAVKRSRENKKKLLPTQCRQQRCLAMASTLEALQKKNALLMKALRHSSSSLSAHERRELDAMMAE